MVLLHDLVKTGNNIERLVELLRAGENPNVLNNDEDTPLHLVALRNEENPQDLEVNLQLAQKLIRYGANVNAINKKGKTPLLFAIQARNCKMVEFLLQKNAKVNLTDFEANTPLHYATRQCSPSLENGYDAARDLDLQMVRTLLNYKPEMNVISRDYRTPLFHAVKNQNLPIVRELLKHKLNLNLKINYRSVIHEALDQKNVNVNIVFELLRHGIRLTGDKKDTLIEIYLRRLWLSPADECQKAKFVFKLFLFCNYSFNLRETRDIRRLSNEKKIRLSQYIEVGIKEISRMKRDRISSNYSVYNIACHGFNRERNCHVPAELLGRVLDKLLNSEYDVYSDLIVSGICNTYLKYRFAYFCSNVENTGREFLVYHVLDDLSVYLSHLDMLNIMKAFLT